MRVISGELRGRQFDAPHGQRTHPMAEKVRGALFNILGDITGLTVLDAFAGSGALSIEAVSRGAKKVVAIDIDRRATETAKKNIRELGVSGKVKVIRANAASWSSNNEAQVFDIVLLAPPYDDLQLNLLEKLTRHLNNGGILVLDWPGKMDLPTIKEFKIIDNKVYGDAQLAFYRRFS